MRRARSRAAVGCLVAVSWAIAIAPAPASAAGTGAIGAFQPLPVQARPLGPVRPSRSVGLTIALQPRSPRALAALVAAVSTPGSPLYRHFLSAGSFAARFGATPATLARVTAVLRAVGLEPGPPAVNRLAIPVRAPAGVVESALHVALTRLRLPGGATGFVNLDRPSLPGGVAGDIQAVVGLDTLPVVHPEGLQVARHPAAARPAPAAGIRVRPAAGPVPCAAATATGREFTGYTANQIARAYGFAPLYQAGDLGQGQQVGLVEFAGFAQTDVQAYLACFGLRTQITMVPVGGGAKVGPGTSEATIDIEDLAGLAPDAGITVYEGPNGANQVIYSTYSAAISADRVRVLSTSWGSCEADARGGGFVAAENSLFQEAAAQGQTIIAAAGDDGSEDCLASDKVKTLAVDDPSSQPDVTGVGGTNLEQLGPPPTETAWNDNLGAGGGGLSTRWAQPSWQTGPGVASAYSTGAPCLNAAGACREVPDVSASASGSHPYVAYCRSGDCSSSAGWLAFFGTSLAAPVWAAVATVADQVCQAAGDSPVGFLDPVLYRLATSTASPFNDIAAGNNDYTHTNGGAYPATPGYDMATGLGSPRASVLAADLCKGIQATPAAVSLTASPAAPTATATVTLSGPSAIGGAAFTAAVAPGAAWLSVSPASGQAPATLTVTANAAGLAPGDYSGTIAVAATGGRVIAIPVTLGVALPPSSPGVYHPLAPVRVLDTRSGRGATGAGRTLGPQQSLVLPLAGVDGVPAAGATAVVLNVTAVGPTRATYLTAYPAGGPRPTASDLSAAAGSTVAGLVTVQLGPTGAVTLFNGAGRVNLVADLEGWYGGTAGGPAGLYHALPPARVADTRIGSGAEGAGRAPGPGGVLTVQVTGAAGVPVSGVAAVALDLTAAGSTASGYVTAYAAGSPRPLASSLNFPAGRVVANRVIVPVGPTGAVAVANARGTTNLVVDVDGWFGDATDTGGSGSDFVATPPFRVTDTRQGSLLPNAGRTLGPGGTLTVQVAGVGSVPPMAGAAPPAAVALVVTVTGDTTSGYLTVYPGGAPPRASDLNWRAGATVANLVLAELSPSGSVTLYNAAGRVNAVVDVVGWYARGG